MPETPRMLTNGEAWKRMGMSSMVTAALTVGAMMGYWQVNPPRDDPYRGSQASADQKELRLELERKISEVERRMVQRMAVMDRRAENILTTQREMWTVIQTLPPDRWRRRIEGIEIWIIKQDDTYDVPE